MVKSQMTYKMKSFGLVKDVLTEQLSTLYMVDIGLAQNHHDNIV